MSEQRNSRGRRMSDGNGFWGIQPQHVPDLLSDYTGRAFLGGGAGLLIGLVAGGIGLAVSMSQLGSDAGSLLGSNKPLLYRSVGVGGVVGMVVGSLAACCSAGATCCTCRCFNAVLAKFLYYQSCFTIRMYAFLQCYWGYEPEPGKILMAVHTNGMGHVIQALRILDVLAANGIQVDTVAFGWLSKVPLGA